jgi:hypothetical protein
MNVSLGAHLNQKLLFPIVLIMKKAVFGGAQKIN